MKTTSLATLFAVLLSTAAWSQELILDDSLRGGTQGARGGGSLGPDGWRVTGKNDFIYWHIPTVSQGAAEFSVRGIIPNDGRAEGYDKNELFHMYDWTYNNADTTYDGYRNGPYKHFIRKTNLVDPGKTNSMEMVLKINSDEIEPDTSILSWDPSRTYRFREEWGPDGAGRCVFKVFRDGVQIMNMSVLGNWTPGGHAVRIGGSTRAPLYPDFGAPIDAVFSDLKVWRTSGSTPPPPPPPGGGVPRVGLSGDQLTINGQPAFLLGVSYFDAVAWRTSDLNEFAVRRFNMIRIWCDWDPSNGKSLLDASGNLVRRQTLIDLVRAAGARGLVVNVTICAPEGNARSADARTNACRNVVAALAGEPNVYFDVMNEHGHGAGPASHADVARFFSAARSASGSAVLTVSDSYVFSGQVDTGHVDAELNAGTQMISPHMERTGDWWAQTGNRTRALKNYLASRGRNIPVLLDEDARRGHSGLNPSRDEFFEAARQARDAGAAGWVFHTDAGFNLSAASFFDSIDSVEREVVDGLANVIFGAGGGPPPPPGGSGSLASGWEAGQPVGPMDQVLYSKDVAGPFNNMNPGPECSPRAGENQHSGSAALMISGFSNAGYAYCYTKMFDDNIAIQNGTKLKYWIFHHDTAKVAVDGHFTDGSTIRDGGYKDQHGVSLHPGLRTDPLGAWHYVEVDLSAAAGKTLDFLMVGFDNGGNGFTGSYRAYVDDFSIGVDVAAPPPPPPPPPPGAFVTIVSIATGGPTSLATAQVNALPYSDRSYAITSLSGRLQGGVLVRIPNSDKYNRSASYLTLSVSEEAFVYVGYDRRGYAVMPRWLDDDAFWSLTGESLSTSDSASSPMPVFVRRVQAGPVTLGGNWEGRDTGAQSNYVVVVQPAAGRTPGGGLEDVAVEAFGAAEEAIPSFAFVSPGDSDGDGLTDGFERSVGLDPFNVYTKATGVADEVATAPGGRTYFEVQAASPASDGSGGGGGCGLTGLEAMALLALLAARRR